MWEHEPWIHYIWCLYYILEEIEFIFLLHFMHMLPYFMQPDPIFLLQLQKFNSFFFFISDLWCFILCSRILLYYCNCTWISGLLVITIKKQLNLSIKGCQDSFNYTDFSRIWFCQFKEANTIFSIRILFSLLSFRVISSCRNL